MENKACRGGVYIYVCCIYVCMHVVSHVVVAKVDVILSQKRESATTTESANVIQEEGHDIGKQGVRVRLWCW